MSKEFSTALKFGSKVPMYLLMRLIRSERAIVLENVQLPISASMKNNLLKRA